MYLSHTPGGEGDAMWRLPSREKTGGYLVVKHALFPLKYFSYDSLPCGEQ